MPRVRKQRRDDTFHEGESSSEWGHTHIQENFFVPKAFGFEWETPTERVNANMPQERILFSLPVNIRRLEQRLANTLDGISLEKRQALLGIKWFSKGSRG